MNIEQLYEQAQQYIARDKHDDAYKILKKLDASIPNHPGILYLLGVCQSKSGKKLNAIRTYRKVLELLPTFVEASNNLGLDLKYMGDLEESLKYFEQAISIRPDFFEAKLNLASVLLDLHQPPSKTLGVLQELLLEQPTHPLIHSNLGRCYLGLLQPTDALAHFKAAHSANPGGFDILKGLAEAAKASKDWAYSDAALDEFIKANPDNNPCKGLIHEARLFQCDWGKLKTVEEEFAGLSHDDQAQVGIKPFSVLSRFELGADQLRLIRAQQNPITHVKKPYQKHPDNKLRIGYISPDFKDHPISYLTQGLFQNHDLNNLTIFAIATDANPPSEDHFRRQIKHAVSGFYEAGHFSDADVIKLLNELQLDILVDLAGHTRESRLKVLEARCAPVQIQFLGFPGTMGTPCIDYTIGDPIVSPLASSAFFEEELILLPDCFQPNDLQRPVGRQNSRADFGLPENCFVFGCFNQCIKITEPVFAAWISILQNCPNSVLWLVGENSAQVNNMTRFALSRGIDPSRLVFSERVDYETHLGRYACVDLTLDTFPFNGGTTTSDALWGGAPVLTLAGEAYASRMSASLLHSLNLDELITYSLVEYTKLACRLAQNPDECTALRKRLALARTSAPTFNIKRYTRHFETGLQMAIDRAAKGLAPHSFLVPEINY